MWDTEIIKHKNKMSFIQLRVTSQTFLVGTENIGQSILNLDIRLDKDLPQ
jgi:hypothetical protein